MNFNKKTILSSPQEVEAQFYQAFAKRDIEAMMAVWADEDDIVCVMPSGQMLEGYANIRKGWEQLFSNGSRALDINIIVRQATDGIMMALHHVIECIKVKNGEKSNSSMVYVVNVYLRTPDGWRLCLHQATTVHAEQREYHLKKTKELGKQTKVISKRTLH